MGNTQISCSEAFPNRFFQRLNFTFQVHGVGQGVLRPKTTGFGGRVFAAPGDLYLPYMFGLFFRPM